MFVASVQIQVSDRGDNLKQLLLNWADNSSVGGKLASPVKAFKSCLEQSPWMFSACLENFQKVPPDQGMTLLSQMNKTARASVVTEVTVDNWTSYLGSYAASASFDRFEDIERVVPPLRRELTREARYLAKHAPKKTTATFEKFRHQINIAAAVAVFVDEAWNFPNKDERNQWKAFQDIYQLVRADGVVDDEEKTILALVRRFLCGFFSVKGSEGLLSLVKRGVELPDSRQTPVSFITGVATYLNTGIKGPYPKKGTPLPQGYLEIKLGDPRLERRVVNRECFSFTLSLTSDSHERLSILDQNYRPVDLRKESATMGDVVVYYFPESKHEL